MDSDTLMAVIGTLSVLSFTVFSIIRLVMRTELQKMQLRAQMKQADGGTATVDVQALRDEITHLRDTSTQYDVSLQHTLERLEKRLEFLERKVYETAEAKADPLPQTISRTN